MGDYRFAPNRKAPDLAELLPCPRAERRALVDKLFVGTDFPNFADPTWEQNASLRGTDYVVNSHLAFQYECLHEAFGDSLSEERMVENFYRLLPAEFEP